MNLLNILVGLILFVGIVASLTVVYTGVVDEYNPPTLGYDYSKLQKINETRSIVNRLSENFNDEGVDSSGLVPNTISVTYSSAKMTQTTIPLIHDIMRQVSSDLGIDPIWITIAFMVISVGIMFAILSLFIPKLVQ